ncbi:MAG: hypothetical protein ACLTER_23875 [Ruminococcus sp.]
MAKQDPSFGHPEKFCSDIAKTSWGICNCYHTG